MARIELSQAFSIQLITRMLGHVQFASTNGMVINATSLLNPRNQNGSNDPGAAIRIMKGVKPTDLSTLTGPTSRASDVLLSFKTTLNATGDFTPTVNWVNPVIVNTNYVAADASGAATWFWWIVADATTTVHQIVGSVGLIGSGADIEIPDVNLVTGNTYRILNLKLGIPTAWNL